MRNARLLVVALFATAAVFAATAGSAGAAIIVVNPGQSI
jgi:hypothetical protein